MSECIRFYDQIVFCGYEEIVWTQLRPVNYIEICNWSHTGKPVVPFITLHWCDIHRSIFALRSVSQNHDEYPKPFPSSIADYCVGGKRINSYFASNYSKTVSDMFGDTQGSE